VKLPENSVEKIRRKRALKTSPNEVGCVRQPLPRRRQYDGRLKTACLRDERRLCTLAICPPV